MAIYKGNTKIVKLYKGSTEIVRKYKGTNLIYQNSLLPSGYIECEYLEATGSQYLDTGYAPNQNTKVETTINVLSHNGSVINYLFGAYDSSRSFAIYYSYNQLDWGVMCGSVDSNTSVSYQSNVKQKLEFDKDYLSINGTNVYNVGSTTTFTSTRTMYLFWGNGTSRLKSISRIYDFKIYENGNIVMNLIPCLDPNGVPCMYDTVSKQTFYNAGTGQFEYDLPIPSNYTELSYIESTGTQFIDTGFTPNQNTKVELTMQKDAGAASFMFGSRISSQSQAFTFQISSGDYKFVSGYGSSTEQSSIVNDGQVHTLMRDKGDFYVDGVLKASRTSTDFTCPANAYLFTIYNNATPTSGTTMKIYSCKIWDNGTPHNYFVPCLDANSVPCFFDKITGNTYYNAGTGTFIAG